METTNFSIPEFFYDLIAILIPGIFAMGYTYFLFPEIADTLTITYPYLNNVFGLLIIAYIIGHSSYSLSSEFVVPIFRFLSGNPIKTLLGKPIKNYQKKFNKYFLREVIEHDAYFTTNVTKGVIKYTGDTTFDLNVAENTDIAYEFCRNFIIEKASKNYTTIRKEQAYGELSRSIILISLIAFFALLINCIFFTTTNYWWLKLLVNLLVFVSFTFRYGQVRHTAPIFIFSTFCTFLTINNFKENKSTQDETI
jgi:hypothetical protein